MGGERHDGTTGRGTSGRTPLPGGRPGPPRMWAFDGAQGALPEALQAGELKGRSVRGWARRSIAKSAHVLTDRMAGFLGLGAGPGASRDQDPARRLGGTPSTRLSRG